MASTRVANLPWETIAAEYTAGATAQELSNKYCVARGTIEGRARRYHWLLQNHEITKRDSTRVAEGVKREIAEIIKEFKDSFMRDAAAVASMGINKSIDYVEKSASVDDLTRAGEAAETFTRIAKPVFGLGNDSATQVGIQVNVLSDLPDPPDAVQKIGYSFDGAQPAI